MTASDQARFIAKDVLSILKKGDDAVATFALLRG